MQSHSEQRAPTATEVDATDVTYCAAHPNVETALHCGKCDTPICPKCMVQTPVGARCRACAQLRRPPMYQLGPLTIVRAVAMSLVAGAILGVIWGLLLPAGIGFFGIFLAIFVGPPIGYFFADLLGRATKHKRGPVMQGIAVGGVILALILKTAVSGYPISADIFALILAATIASGAIGRLR